MQSFWTSNPCVPSWIETLRMRWFGEYPKLLQANPPIHRTGIPGFLCRPAELEELEEVCAFWYSWYNTAPHSRCVIPAWVVKECVLLKRWEILLVRKKDEASTLIGTIVRRNIENLQVYEAKWPQACVVDFYCIHPAYRKKGIGRLLLAELQNSGKRPFAPHLILWEFVNPFFPPLSVGGFYYRMYGTPLVPCTVLEGVDAEKVWNSLTEKKPIRSGWMKRSRELSVYRVGTFGYIAIWNTYHVSLPAGKPVNIVIAYTSMQTLQVFCGDGSKEDGFLIAPRTSLQDTFPEGWKFDSMFQWVAYNLAIGKVCSESPCLGF